MRELVQMDEITKAIRSQIPARQMKHLPELTGIQKEWLKKRFRSSDFSDKMRLNYYLGTVLESEEMSSGMFSYDSVYDFGIYDQKFKIQSQCENCM